MVTCMTKELMMELLDYIWKVEQVMKQGYLSHMSMGEYIRAGGPYIHFEVMYGKA